MLGQGIHQLAHAALHAGRIHIVPISQRATRARGQVDLVAAGLAHLVVDGVGLVLGLHPEECVVLAAQVAQHLARSAQRRLQLGLRGIVHVLEAHLDEEIAVAAQAEIRIPLLR